ncbi:MAG TPA: DUF4097 family beta strand repeat-containing protein [Spirochaetia bacterium]|nr:DUF4097 family beta strand repeat-containing protein [Spirochaetia bacterium]
MNEERTMILKMLKDGKITLEEADALMEVIDDLERQPEGRSDSGPAAATSGSSDEGPKAGRGDEWWDRLFTRGPDIDFSDLNRTFKETVGSIQASVEQAVAGIGNLNLAAEINRALGNIKAECVQEATAPESDAAVLRLKNRWGDIRIVGDDSTAVRVRAHCTAWGGSQSDAEANLSHIKIEFESQGETLVLSTEKKRQGIFDRIRIDYEVTVPRGTAVSLGTASGDISVLDVAASVSVASLSGSIRAQNIAGTQRYLTKSGDIELEMIDGEVKANSMSGDVRVQLRHDAAFRVAVDSITGKIVCSLALEKQTAAKGRLEGTLNGGTRMLSIRTASGDISLTTI